ncbi:MAG: type II secretion system secretin GspD [Gammaproteobacteria bacterium]|nr:type II secretion system secretin GspD [Gammaproteobacteria bacterium]
MPLLLVALITSGCEYMPRTYTESLADTDRTLTDGETAVAPARVGASSPIVGGPRTNTPSSGATSSAVKRTPAYIQPGTERFVRNPKSRKPSASGTGDVTLNFENTNILEVVKVILGDLLAVNYKVEPGVQGAVTLQTSRPITRDALLPTLEMLLDSNSAALVEADGVYHVVPREGALRGLVVPKLGGSGRPIPAGYSVRVVPLRYISAQEMHKILEPFADPGSIVRVDAPRNLLVLAGPGPVMERLIETIDVFDVDWLKGMSVGLFTPTYVDAPTLVEELNAVFQAEEDGPLAGLVRLVPIERLNAVLAVTPRKSYLTQVESWVRRLDRDAGGVGQQLFVYYVENGRAADLAAVLGEVFPEGDNTRRQVPEAEVAPGLRGTTVRRGNGSSATASPTTRRTSVTSPGATTTTAQQVQVRPGAQSATRASSQAREGIELAEGSPIRIIADEVNNALLIKATAQEYQLVEAALKKLDIVPLQVLIEATIAEISLSDDLAYGLEWFFKNDLGSKRGTGTLDLGAATLSAVAPGFSYAITDAAGAVRAVLNTLASESRVNVLSSPSLMVLNNQTASINVGDEVPITTQQQQSTAVDSTVVNNIEFRDTGVLLTVTPRVNSGGLVTMEVEQEVSNVAPGTGNSLTPTIQQRKISSTVAVASGETVVLGGLIRENNAVTKGGFPLLHTVPVVGALFGTTSHDTSRTELVVLITPRAIGDRDEARRITDEFRTKMESLKSFVPIGIKVEPAVRQ